MNPASGLFDLAAPARASSSPQVEAAELLRRSGTVGRQARRILEVLAAGPPLTREEVCFYTRIPEHSACARLRELECPGAGRPLALGAPEPLVRKAGRKEARSGVHVWLYEVTDAGRKAL